MRTTKVTQCDEVQYLGNCCGKNVKFLRGVLLRMRDSSADGVFQLAILALLKTGQTLMFLAKCPPRLPTCKSKMISMSILL